MAPKATATTAALSAFCGVGMGLKLHTFSRSLLMLLVLTCSALADAGRHPLSQPGTWDIAISLGQVVAKEHGSPAGSHVSTAGLQVGRVILGPSGQGWIRGTLEYGFELIPVFATTKPEAVHGGGFDIFLLRCGVPVRFQSKI